jgi:L-rhamnose isomerase
MRPIIKEWRALRGIPEAPLAALAENGYLQRISAKRRAKLAPVSSYA